MTPEHPSPSHMTSAARLGLDGRVPPVPAGESDRFTWMGHRWYETCTAAGVDQRAGPGGAPAGAGALRGWLHGRRPSHPLGGPDGIKDAVAVRRGERWIMGSYFLLGHKPFKEIKAKFLSDYRGVRGDRRVWAGVRDQPGAEPP